MVSNGVWLASQQPPRSTAWLLSFELGDAALASIFEGMNSTLHKDLLPLDGSDVASLILSALGLILAAGGGIGGGMYRAHEPPGTSALPVLVQVAF